MYRTIGIIMMATWLPGIALSQPKNIDQKALIQCVVSQPNSSGFSGVVALSQSGRIDVLPVGLIGAAESLPITDKTRFNIGSAGKMFTAVAIGQLMDAGKLNLDDPVGRYIEGLKPETSAVTIRQLLTHTSGLGNFFTPDDVPQLQRIKGLADIMPLIASDSPHFAPGSRFEYSNTGYALLGLVVERASGLSFGDYLADNIFTPAKMLDSGLSFRENDTAIGLSAGGQGMLPPRDGPARNGSDMRPPPPQGAPPLQVSNGPLHPTPESSLPATSAGGLFSTASDMVRFLQAVTDGTLLSPNTADMFTKTQVDSAPAKGDLPALHYGFGFGTGTVDGHEWFGHNGGAPGLNAEVIAFPKDDIFIVVLANRDPPTATQLFRSLRSVVLDPQKRKNGC